MLSGIDIIIFPLFLFIIFIPAFLYSSIKLKGDRNLSKYFCLCLVVKLAASFVMLLVNYYLLGGDMLTYKNAVDFFYNLFRDDLGDYLRFISHSPEEFTLGLLKSYADYWQRPPPEVPLGLTLPNPELFEQAYQAGIAQYLRSDETLLVIRIGSVISLFCF